MAQTNPSDTELVEKSCNNTNNVNSEVQSEPVSLVEKLKALIGFFTVEPFLLCYLLPSVISAVTVQKLNLEKACRTDLGNPAFICADVITGDFDENDNSTALISAASTQSQVLVADMTAWKQPLQSGIPAIVILFVGAWSDRTGNRKALMLVPILGELIAAIGLILTTYFFEWPLWVTGLIEAIPTAFTGGLSIALMGSYSFIADVTTVESRTFRIGVVAVIVTLGIPIGSAISGVLTESVGYYGIFGLDVALYTLGLFYTYFRIKDAKRKPIEGTCFNKLFEFFNPKNAWETLSLLFLSRGYELVKILLVIFAHIVIIGPVFGEGGVLFLYFLQKYHITIIEFSLFSTYMVLVGLAGTTIAITVFSKWLKIHDAIIGIIATISRVAGSFMYALAPTRSWLYSAPVIDIFGNTGSTAIRSLGTKVVPPEKVGKMCSLIGFVEAVVPVIYGPIYSKVYSNTLETFAGAFYLLGGVMTIPAVFIFIFLYCMHRKEEKDIVKNPAEKEKYAHENAVTVL